VRLRAALGLNRAEFNDLSLFELTQFAFAKGEEELYRMNREAEAVFKAIDTAFSDDPNQAMTNFWNQLMSRVNYEIELTEKDYKAHNDKMAATLTGVQP